MESIEGLERTNYCGDFTSDDIGRHVTAFGWVQKVRNLGGLIFIDLRDRTGILQCVFDEAIDKSLADKAFTVRGEFVLAVQGVIRQREAPNPQMPTGSIELIAADMRILASAKTPPFEIASSSNVNDELRLRYRYLDLRRPDAMAPLLLRSKTYKVVRDYFAENGFIEVETPMLLKSTPEGARDYLVPSRVQPGRFFALPQSPQLYKQILMLSGFDRYIQIARCFRDEDLRAERQPDFTQIDLEMSFVTRKDIIAINEGMLKRVFKSILDVDIETPFLQMTYAEAMRRFGSDRPDLRYEIELVDISETARSSSFEAFKAAVGEGGSVRAIVVPGGATRFSRKEIDTFVEYVKTYRAKGLAWIRLGAQSTSSFSKSFSREELDGIVLACGASNADLVLIVADPKDEVVFASLGALRCEIARRLGLIEAGMYKFLWVVDFPLLERDEETNRYHAVHHPFTSPLPADMPLLDTDPLAVRADAYDCVLNGMEIGGGSIRIHDIALQAKMFSLLGFSPEQAKKRFGFLLEAFEYGAPPHGGLAYGLDRLIMLLSGEDNIRNVIAFPKVQTASELMSGAPDTVDLEQLKELSLRLWDYDRDSDLSVK